MDGQPPKVVERKAEQAVPCAVGDAIRRSVFLALVATAGAFAQHHMSPASEKPVALMPGLGTWRHPIATQNTEAQKFFDQGLSLIYSFNRYEAFRSFRKAAELDPKAAMAFWGIAMSEGPYVNMDMDPFINMKEACEASSTGLSVSGPAERPWLEAAASRCPDYADPSRYISAMQALAARLPDDPDAQTLYADALMIPIRWRWYDSEGKPADGEAEAERVLEGVLRRYPNHPGANHLYIHAVESSSTPERAVPSAQRLMGIVPAAGHMVHMPGHIWLRLGDYDNAVAVNERAAEVDREYFAKTGVMSSYGGYYLHNLQFLLYSRAMQGRSSEASKVSSDMTEVVKGMAASMPEMVDLIGAFITMMQVRVMRWDEVLAGEQPKIVPAATALWHHARAIAYLAKNDRAAAGREKTQFEAICKTLDRNMPWSTNKTGDVMDFAAAVLAARMEADPAKAASLWRQAVALQDKLAYDEPPVWYSPARESLGASLFMGGDVAGAEEVFREGLRRSPNNGRMLFGLLESLKAQKKTEAVHWVQREYESSWKGAELQLRMKDL